jgi:hypothetical protein
MFHVRIACLVGRLPKQQQQQHLQCTIWSWYLQPGQGRGKTLEESAPGIGGKLFLSALQGVAVWGTRTMPGTALQNYLELTSDWSEGEAAIHAYNINRSPIKKYIPPLPPYCNTNLDKH